MTTLYQRLALEDLPIAPLLRGILVLFLLGYSEVSHLSSHVILRDWWQRIPSCYSILHENLDGLNQENQRGMGHETSDTTLTRGSYPWLGRIGTLSMSFCLKLPITHRAR
jgi:hypothetical protein